jgi:DNA-binding transcriptional LysR family regulator
MYEIGSDRSMDLRSLRHIVVLARELNFTRAADKLGVTQSALSRSIREFEARHAVRLFDRARGGGGVCVTSVGLELVAAAASMLHQEKDLRSLIERATRGESGRVAFGVGRLRGRSILPNILLTVLNEKPGIKIDVVVEQFRPLLSLLDDEKIEFFICGRGSQADTAALDQEMLGDHPFGLEFFVRPGHPLLSLDKPSGEAAIRGAPYPIVTSTTRFDFTIPVPLNKYLDRGARIRSSDMAALSLLAQSSDAILVTSGTATRAEVDAANLVELRPKPQAPRSFPMALYRARGRTLSAAANWIISLFRSELENMTEKDPAHSRM